MTVVIKELYFILDMNDDRRKAIEILILLCGDGYSNKDEREFAWYGLWNRQLRIFEEQKSLKDCAVFPQYPLWLKEPKALPPHLANADPEDPMTASQIALYRSLNQTTPPRSIQSRYPVISPLEGKGKSSAAGPSRNMRTSQGSTKKPNSEKEMGNIRKYQITDFALLHVLWGHVYIGQEKPYSIRRILVPILIEIKLYREEEIAPDIPDANIYAIQISRARKSAIEQVEFLLSQQKQQEVIAIAAAGPHWCYRLFKDSEVLPLAGDVNDTKQNYFEWSETYKLNTSKSDKAFLTLVTNVQEFIQTNEEQRSNSKPLPPDWSFSP